MKAMLAALGVLCMVTMSLSAGVDEGVNEEPLEAPAPDDALAQALQRYITGPEMLLRYARSEGRPSAWIGCFVPGWTRTRGCRPARPCCT